MNKLSGHYGKPKKIMLSEGLDQSLSSDSPADINGEPDHKCDYSSLQSDTYSLDEGTIMFSNKNIV